jgi:hypothetical protein
MWKDLDKTRQHLDYENIIYNFKGNIMYTVFEWR